MRRCWTARALASAGALWLLGTIGCSEATSADQQNAALAAPEPSPAASTLAAYLEAQRAPPTEAQQQLTDTALALRKRGAEIIGPIEIPNLKELVTWGLVRSVFKKGERKEYFEAEKNVWKMFCIILRERRRRELRPAMGVLEQCAARTKGLKGPEATAFNQQIKELSDFLALADNVITKLSRSEQSTVIPWAIKFLK